MLALTLLGDFLLFLQAQIQGLLLHQEFLTSLKSSFPETDLIHHSIVMNLLLILSPQEAQAHWALGPALMAEGGH